VIDLVLEKLRAIAFHLDFLPFALEILVSHPNTVGARHPDQEVGK
jgi:hypothetical protein